MAEKKITITLKEYEDLHRDALLLDALYSLGVEDWDFFSDAVAICDGLLVKDEHYEETMDVN